MISLDVQVTDSQVAEDSERALRTLDVRTLAPVSIRVGEGAEVILPERAAALLFRILGHLANGDAVTVVPVQAEITAQQAAELLGVSRPFLIKLIDAGKVPCRMVGTHRRIPLVGLLAFQKADLSERRALAAELTAEAQELGFEY